MKANKLTDEGFGERIGKERIQVFRYRHGHQIPRKKTMQRIFEETGGQVPSSSFYLSKQAPQ